MPDCITKNFRKFCECDETVEVKICLARVGGMHVVTKVFFHEKLLLHDSRKFLVIATCSIRLANCFG